MDFVGNIPSADKSKWRPRWSRTPHPAGPQQRNRMPTYDTRDLISAPLIDFGACTHEDSDRKRTEDTLRAQDELLRGIIDGIPVMLTIYDPKLQTFRFNPELRRVLGWTEEDAADGRFMEKVYPDPVERQQVAAFMQSLQSGWRDWEPTAKDGTRVLSSWANIRLANDTQIGIGIDIRPRVAAEEALRNSQEAVRDNEQRYRSFIEATAQIVWTTNTRGEVNLEIPAWQTFTGQSSAEARGFGWMNAVHPEDRAGVTDAWAQAFASRSVYEVEYRLRRHDGAWRNILARGVPVPDAGGNVREYIGTCIDITERKQAELARRESDARLRLTADALPVLVGYVDAEQRYRFTNAAYAQWFGLNPKPGQHVREVVGEAAYASRLPLIKRALAGETVVFEELMPHRAKGPRDTETSYVPDLADDGKTVRGFVALVYDITERRQSEEALRQAKREADKANEAKDHFLAVLSHELRTPLAPVLAAAQMLESDASLAPEHRDMAQMIRRNVELEARLIDDLLDLTRIARNKLELQLATIDVHEKIVHVLRICHDEIAAKQLVVRTDLAAELRHLRADPARFQQIIWNLLKNAVKFTPASGHITVRTRSAADASITIEVIDDGVGIEPAALPRIFDAFEQGGSNVTRTFGGLGLGLAISKALIEMHGGTIAAASEGRGKGSRFTVALPAPSTDSTKLAGPATDAAAGVSCTILLVEDHADTRRAMARLLTRLGCEVTSAATVGEALQLAASQSFRLLISDLGLPDGSGTDVIRQLKARHGIKGIALSGFGMEDDIARSKEAGFDAHLTKPVSLHALEATVRRLTL